jgi:hypothetical protein
MNKGYYAIIPADVRYDVRLTPNAKLLYGEITALCNEKGFCWAMNEYFAELYSVSKVSVSKWVGNLRDCGYIDVQMQYKEGTKQISNRYIRLATPLKENFGTLTKKSLIPSPRKVKDPIKEKFKDNNTFNNTFNNTLGETSSPVLSKEEDLVKPKKKAKKKPKKKPHVKFIQPTLEEVTAHCEDKNSNVDPVSFWHFYESKGWMIGKNKMQSWQSAIGTWTRSNNIKAKENANKQNAKSEYASLNSDYNKSTGLV